MWRCVKVNNIPPKGSPCHVLNLNKMIVKSSCRETCEKIMGMNMHKIVGQTGKKSKVP